MPIIWLGAGAVNMAHNYNPTILQAGQRWMCHINPGYGKSFCFTLVGTPLAGIWDITDCTTTHYQQAYSSWWEHNPYNQYTMILLCTKGHDP